MDAWDRWTAAAWLNLGARQLQQAVKQGLHCGEQALVLGGGSSELPSRREHPRSLCCRLANGLAGRARQRDQWEISKAHMGRPGQE